MEMLWRLFILLLCHINSYILIYFLKKQEEDEWDKNNWDKNYSWIVCSLLNSRKNILEDSKLIYKICLVSTILNYQQCPSMLHNMEMVINKQEMNEQVDTFPLGLTSLVCKFIVAVNHWDPRQTAWAQILTLLLSSCVSLSKLLSLPILGFSHLKHEEGL